MSGNYQDKIFALQQAEQDLTQKEQAINFAYILPSGVTEIMTDVCGVKFYEIDITGQYNKATVSLESIFAVVYDNNECDPKPAVKAGRQSWLEK